jgi:hypothetical protein
MVPPTEFTSYYGHPIVKASPWKEDIPAYLFLGGLAGGSSLLAAGADLGDLPALRRAGRWTALAGILGSSGLLVHDLGRPARFHHMLRVAKPSSPMSVGTWVLTAYGPLAGLAAAGELRGLLPRRWRDSGPARTAPRLAGIGAAAVAPAVASYTAVLLSDTATPTWHETRQELPFVFVGSAAAAAGGAALALTPTAESGPARRLAVGGAALDLLAGRVMEQRAGVAAEPLRQGRAKRLMDAARALTAGGALLAGLGRRSRVASGLGGAALVAGSVCTRFGLFEAGQQSARDPRYTVVPQRERLARRERAHVPG